MEIIANTGCLGIPDEHFCPQNRARFTRKNNLPEAQEDQDLVRAIVDHYTLGSGIFSVKLFPYDLDWLLRIFGAEGGSVDWQLLGETFPNASFIRIDRKDKLAQAISLVKSQQTSLWHSDAAPFFRHLQPYYDLGQLSRAKSILESDSQRWDNFFRRNAVQPLSLNYEEFSKDLMGSVGTIFEFLQVKSPAKKMVLPEKRILRDSVSEEWKKRYEAETRTLNEVESVEFVDRRKPAVEIQSNLAKTLAANFPVQIDFMLKNLLPFDLYCLGTRDWTGRFFLMLEMVNTSNGEKIRTVSNLPARWGSQEKLKVSMIMNSPKKPGVYSVFVKVLQRNNGFLESSEPFHQVVTVIDPVRSLYEEFFGKYEERADQWVYATGFGFSFWKRFPWVRHELHGWIKVTGTSDNQLFVHDQALGDWVIIKRDHELIYFSQKYGEFTVNRSSVRTICPLASKEEIKQADGYIVGRAELWGESLEEIIEINASSSSEN